MRPAIFPKQKTAAEYKRLWRIVDGAVMDAFKMHPEYLAGRTERVARTSVVKRVVGALMGSAKAEGRASD